MLAPSPIHCTNFAKVSDLSPLAGAAQPACSRRSRQPVGGRTTQCGRIPRPPNAQQQRLADDSSGRHPPSGRGRSPSGRPQPVTPGASPRHAAEPHTRSGEHHQGERVRPVSCHPGRPHAGWTTGSARRAPSRCCAGTTWREDDPCKSRGLERLVPSSPGQVAPEVSELSLG
jgi:hypothetical protein